MESEKKFNKVVDMSPFFLFEAVGDSEGGGGDVDHQMMKVMVMGRLGHHVGDEDDDDDDAESCSHDVWDQNLTTHFNRVGSSHDHGDDNQHHHGLDDDDDGEVDGKVMGKESISWKGNHGKMNHSRYDDDDHQQQQQHYDHDHHNNSTSEVMSTANSHSSRRNPSSCVDSSEGKKMSEKERSRLFWETCLAS